MTPFGCLIPIPPSVNHAWKIVRTRSGVAAKVRSKQYDAWIQEAVLRLRFGMDPAVTYPVAVTVTIGGGSGFRVNRDIDNVLKPVVDALRHAERIREDDVRHVRRVACEYLEPADPKQPAGCWVRIEPLTESTHEG